MLASPTQTPYNELDPFFDDCDQDIENLLAEDEETYDDDFIYDYENDDREWTDEDEAHLEEWEERKRQRIAEKNEY